VLPAVLPVPAMAENTAGTAGETTAGAAGTAGTGTDIAVRLARLPAQYNGRVQPLDTVARNTLLILGGKQEVRLSPEEAAVLGKRPSQWSAADKAAAAAFAPPLDAALLASLERRPLAFSQNLVLRAQGFGGALPASRFLAELAFRPQLAARLRVFRIENAEVRALLPARAGAVGYYSLEDLRSSGERGAGSGERGDSAAGGAAPRTPLDIILERDAAIRARPNAERGAAERAFVKLADALGAYHSLSVALAPFDLPAGVFPNDDYAAWHHALAEAAAALRRPPPAPATPAPPPLLARPGYNAAGAAGNAPAGPDPRLAAFIRATRERYREIRAAGTVGIVPPALPAAAGTTATAAGAGTTGATAAAPWGKLGDALLAAIEPRTASAVLPVHGRNAAGDTGDPLALPAVITLYGDLAKAWQLADDRAATAALDALDAAFAAAAGNTGTALEKVRAEVVFNRVEPFYKALALYLAVFVLVCAGWALAGRRVVSGQRSVVSGLKNGEENNGARSATLTGHWPLTTDHSAPLPLRLAWLLLVLVFVLHTAALVWRTWLHGRPPATNLYSTAIVVAWGAVLLGIVAERFLKNGVGTAAAALTGFGSLIIAHNLSLGGDTLNVMRAVLDSNFWLATHVVTITLGYSAMFVAGLLAAFALLRRALARSAPVAGGTTGDTLETTERVVHGVLCFALLLSFAGTMLGGVWADKSWGRFWGWDPKENGALLIVLWCALTLHVRWGNLLGARGRLQLAVFGNIVTAGSWFGTNLLGKGLHSYGFSDGGARWLYAFWLSQLLIIALGWLPKKQTAGGGL